MDRDFQKVLQALSVFDKKISIIENSGIKDKDQRIEMLEELSKKLED